MSEKNKASDRGVKGKAAGQSLRVSEELHGRIVQASNVMGLPVKALTEALLQEALSRLEEAGSVTIGLDGSVKFTSPSPAFKPGYRASPPEDPNKPKPGSPERRQQILKGPAREINM